MADSRVCEFNIIKIVLNKTYSGSKPRLTIGSNPEAVVGDIGAVVLVLESPEGKKAYEVECVLAFGETKLVGSFERNQLKFRR